LAKRTILSIMRLFGGNERRENVQLPYVPGNAVEGHCSECKCDTVQTVIEVEGLQIKTTRCEKCGHEGPLMMAREKAKAALRDLVKKRNSTAPPKRTRRKPEDPAQIFRRLLEGKEISHAVKYSIKSQYEIGQVIKHPTFGIGVVTAILEPSKISVTFEDTARMMVCNRK